jgi:hypothetical protein
VLWHLAALIKADTLELRRSEKDSFLNMNRPLIAAEN